MRNRQEITLDYFLGILTVELSWLVVAALVLGTVAGWFAMLASVLRLRSEVRRLEKRNQQSARELASLRAVAHKDGS